MTYKLVLGRGMRTWRPRFADYHRSRCPIDQDTARIGDQAKSYLPSAGELDIDLREKLGIEQRAVLHAMAAVDTEADAEGVEAVLRSWMLRTRKREGVDHAAHAHRGTTAAFELDIQEAEIECGIVCDQRRIFDEVEELLDFLEEARLVRKEDRRKTVDCLRIARHLPFGIEISVEMPASFDAVVNLYAADLDHAVTTGGAQASSLSVENDLPHGMNLSSGADSETSENVANLVFSCG